MLKPDLKKEERKLTCEAASDTFHIRKCVEGLKVYFLFPPVARKKPESVGADRALGTVVTTLGNVPTISHQSGISTNMTKGPTEVGSSQLVGSDHYR